ncbi:DUF11 domain-containing protein [Paenibacillus sp. IB182493]|uniref:DUF11 domain-containing protein n=1 Tax=Paenibacillus arenilitoris TaxID=2772299 RepID=A0A927CLG4_9BACL|nr:DUF11 domain-containing protein [Paenibacillus arenilitoris]
MDTIPLIVRATFNATGAITFTGNTLGLSRSDVSGVPGTQDSIGAFATTNAAVRYGIYPLGTTDNYLSSGASAQLVLPAGSTILYAELIWGGSYINGSVNLSSAINNAVTFATPAGSFTVAPDSATASDLDLGSGVRAYVRTSIVTSLVQQGGAGTYSTGRVPGTIVINNDPTGNHAGWTLGVIYQNPALPFRNMSIRAGAVLIQSTSSPVTTTLTGFSTPVSGATSGRALFSAQEGDANRNGDQALFGPTASNLVALSGPNNFANNFFASQINNDAGQLNTMGTFGNRNQTNGSPGTNISGGRQGWDITNVDISARLVNNQTSAVLRLTTSGDAYVVNANAIQVDINAPLVTVAKSANASGALVGDTIRYTVTVSNTGTANATNAILSDALPAGAAFASGSVTVGGVARPANDIAAGVPLGTLAPGASIAVAYSVQIVSMPAGQQLVNVANLSFSFQSVAGGPITPAVIPSNQVALPVYSPLVTLAKSANTGSALVGTTVTFTLTAANNGNIAAAVTVSDPIPAGAAFVPNSVTVNGTPQPGANIATGVSVGSLSAGASAVVAFQLLVQSVPSPPQLSNRGAASATFQIPDGRTSSQSALSNLVELPVALPNVTAVKSASLADAAAGETITYSIAVSNGSAGPVTDVVAQDSIPAPGQFVAGSVRLNGTAVPSANPASGIVIGTLAAGAGATVTFDVVAAALPASGQLTNQSYVAFRSGAFNSVAVTNAVTVPIYQPVIATAKSVDRNIATVGDTLTYSVFVTNSGNLAASATLTDPLPEGVSFVAGSVTVNTVTVPGASPLTGIPLGGVEPGSAVPIRLQAVVEAVPPSSRLVNQSTAAYSFQLPSGRSFTGLTSPSNVVDIQVTVPNVSVAKSVSAATAVLNDVLTYDVVIANDGVEGITEVVFSDAIPDGLVFIPGTVTIGGTAAPIANPAAGVALGGIPAGGEASVAFQVRVVSVPLTIPAVAANRANVSFTSGAFKGTAASPLVETAIYQPVIQVVKSSSVSAITVGGTFVYTLQVTNAGNYPADVVLTDIVPAVMAFVPNSVVINGFPNPGVEPSTGIPLDTLSAGETNTVSFSVNVIALPSPQQIGNQAEAAFEYTLPDGRTLAGSAVSPASAASTVTVSAPDVDVVKSAGTVSAVTGDAIIYTVAITNNGLEAVDQVVLIDRPQDGLTFVPGTVAADGIPMPLASPVAGIPLGTIAASATVTVTFEVIISMPVPSPISNQSTVSFTSGTFASSSLSNIVQIPVTQPVIALTKSASTADATLGDTIVYSIAVANSGNVSANVTLTDPPPAGTIFRANTVVVGGVPLPGASPAEGIPMGAVAPDTTVVVTFEVIVDSLPSPQTLANQAGASYTFVPPDGRTLTGSAASNTVSIHVSAPNVTLVKSSTTTNTAIGDIVPFSIAVTNAGIAAVTNIVLVDAIPPGASFVTGSVTVNGTPVPGAVPSSGISLDTIAPGGLTTVAFNVRVDALPSSGTIANQASVSYNSGAFTGTSISNTSAVPVNQPVIAAVKSSVVADATVGDTVNYVVNVSNAGNYGASLTLTDNVPAGTSFLANSVLVGGIPQPGATPAMGISLGNLGAGDAVSVAFSVLIEELPAPPQLVNQATVAAEFTLPDGRPFSTEAVSNSVVVGVRAPNVAVVKSTATTATTVGDTIEYAINVANNGITAVTDTILTDPLPTGTAFVPGSVTVNGTPVAGAIPATGISLGTIAAGASVPVTFQISVISVPDDRLVSNRAFVSFTSGSLSAASFSEIVTTPVYRPSLTLVKSSSSANATVGDTIVYSTVLSNAGNIAANVAFTDVIPDGAALVPNSVLLNGASLPGADPSEGIPLGPIAPNAQAALTFSVVVPSLPATQQLVNQASASYGYSLPDGRLFNGSAVSNTVVVPVSSPDVTLLKGTTFTAATVGDVIPYTVTIANNGVQSVTSVSFTDPLPAFASFVAGSVTLDGTPLPNANPSTGIPIGTIAAGGSASVAFSVTVESLPPSGQLTNQSSAAFSSGAFSGVSYSNPLNLPVYQAQPAVAKSASAAVATVGDTIVYTLDLTNTGNIAAAVTLTDPIPTGAEFVPNSVIVGGVPQPGADPEAGFSVGAVPPGGTLTVSVTLQVTVESLPSPQQLANQATATYSYALPDGRSITGAVTSNTVTIPVSAPDVSVVKSTPAIDAVSGDTVTYTVVATNNGISPVNNVVFVDPIPQGSSFVAGSVTVDGTQLSAADPAIGIPIGSIAAGDSVEVTFQVLVS